jgi:hypothetical protein
MGTTAATRTEPPKADFEAVDRRLREILLPLRSTLVATKDGPDGLSLEIPGFEGKPYGYVAGIRRGKRYVSYYLMPVYAFPDLFEFMSPELRRRMQGKSCFNFTKVDEPLFAELERVTTAGLEPYVALATDVAIEKHPVRPR